MPICKTPDMVSTMQNKSLKELNLIGSWFTSMFLFPYVRELLLIPDWIPSMPN